VLGPFLKLGASESAQVVMRAPAVADKAIFSRPYSAMCA
jgi:hypothetical protein